MDLNPWQIFCALTVSILYRQSIPINIKSKT